MAGNDAITPAATNAADLATTALRLEHLNARVQAQNIARLGNGDAAVFSLDLEAAYAALRAASMSPAAATTVITAANTELSRFAGLQEVPVPPGDSPDDRILSLTRATSRYEALADAIARHYALSRLAIQGNR